MLALDTDFDGCMRIVQEVTADRSLYLANSMNPLRMEGQKTVGIEIVQQFDWEVPDWIIIPAGNLGNVSALGKGLLMMKRAGPDRAPAAHRLRPGGARQPALPELPGPGSSHTTPVQAQKTLASAIQIGAPVSYERAVKVLRQFDGVVEQASEDELANASARADRNGLFCCPQTGVALAALFKLMERGRDPPLGAGDRHLDRQRAEVHRLQGGLPRGRTGRRGSTARQPAAGASSGRRAGAGGD